MRGKVLAYDDLGGTGLISGDDGQRYPFVRGALQGGVRAVVPGTEVDFQLEDGKAASVYVVAFGVEKSRIVAAILAVFVGHWGIHKFYLGKINAGVIMLLLGTVGWLLIIPAVVNWVIAFIEFIIYLTKSDQEFYQEYVAGDRSWF
ncbi:MAG TPA: TM2 domain-containing protein [Caulobacteraceae bacterium]|jgi:TM2 domain-containing membrane protein YozV|nr:TM2 domain-containing protein [Caulobacteraceae bacterium]